MVSCHECRKRIAIAKLFIIHERSLNVELIQYSVDAHFVPFMAIGLKMHLFNTHRHETNYNAMCKLLYTVFDLFYSIDIPLYRACSLKEISLMSLQFQIVVLKHLLLTLIDYLKVAMYCTVQLQQMLSFDTRDMQFISKKTIIIHERTLMWLKFLYSK